MMTFKEYWYKDLVDKIKRKSFRHKEYEHALQALHSVIQRKGGGTHSLEYYAAQIAKTYKNIAAKELAKYYRELETR
jgi:hypothetical protein